jgi:flavodoxin
MLLQELDNAIDGRVALVVASKHHGNTLKVAEAIAAEIDGDILSVTEAQAATLSKYKLVGFGSGIYFARHDAALLSLAKEMASVPKQVFLFSTAGNPLLFRFYHMALRNRLRHRDCKILGEFNCPGWDTFGPFAWIGGLHKHRPNKRDIESARLFARGLRQFLGKQPKTVEV